VRPTYSHPFALISFLLVALELFPLMTETGSKSDMWIGVTVGFAIAFAALHGIESVIDFFSAEEEDSFVEVYENIPTSGLELTDVETGKGKRLGGDDQYQRTAVLSNDGEELLDNPTVSAGQWEKDGVLSATRAINLPNHRKHILEHFHEVQDLIQKMENKSHALMNTETLALITAELLAEEIDESVHQLQYKLDHCRRLLQGSESGKDDKVDFRKTWLTEDKKLAIKNEVKVLNHIVEHLMDHLSSDQINHESIQEIHDHMQDMDRHISHFHDYVDRFTWKWKSTELVETTLGDVLPNSLIIPVIIDCFVDGFLIGITIAVSPKAGYILAAANCLEMGSLGMAYSSRIAKCTGSTLLYRQLAVIIPPIIMFLASGLGAAAAGYSDGVPAVFVAFVAFGVFALISLICCELIIEAREVQDAEDMWWMELFIFIGIYLVIMIEPVF
jgi:zinc transporter ZupT